MQETNQEISRTIEVRQKLPVITIAFDAEKARLETELELHQGVVVTIDGMKDDKLLAQSLTAMGKEYDIKRKAVVAAVSEPIKVFDEQMKTLKSLCDESALAIKSQIAVFESAKLKEIDLSLADMLRALRDASGTDQEFQTGTPPKAKLGFFTAKSALTKAAKEALIKIVDSEKAMQTQTDLRLAQLKAESLDAGLNAALIRANVEHFLFSDKDQYAASLAVMIESELFRQEEGERRKARLSPKVVDRPLSAEDSARARALLSGSSKLPEVNAEMPIPNIRGPRVIDGITGYAPDKMPFSEAPIDTPPKLRAGNIAVRAIATFDLSVPSHITDKQINDKLIAMLESAGIASLSTLVINRD